MNVTSHANTGAKTAAAVGPSDRRDLWVAHHRSADDDGLMAGSMGIGMPAWTIADPFEDFVASFVAVCVASVLDRATRPTPGRDAAARGERNAHVGPERVDIPREKRRECCWKAVSDAGTVLRRALAIENRKPFVLVDRFGGLIVGECPTRGGTMLSVPLLQTIAAELDERVPRMRHGCAPQ